MKVEQTKEKIIFIKKRIVLFYSKKHEGTIRIIYGRKRVNISTIKRILYISKKPESNPVEKIIGKYMLCIDD